MSPDGVISRAPGVVTGTVDGDTILMAPTDSRCFVLTGVADRVWKLLEQPSTMPALVSELTRRYDVDEATCSVEVTTLVADMRAAGVLRP